MFAKLFKYEMKAVSRIFLVAWPALLVLAVINGLFMMSDGYIYQSNSGGILQLIMMIAFIMLFAAVIVMTLIVIIMRFYKGLLRDEGYLMFTLPVTTRQIITAKGLSATIIALAGVAVGTIAIIVLAMPSQSAQEIAEAFAEMYQVIVNVDGWYIYLIEVIIMVIATTMATIYQMYAAMSIGQLAQKHKIAWSFAAYVGISIFLSIIVWVFGIAFPIAETDIYTYIIEKLVGQQLIGHLLILGYMLTQIIQVVAFHIICEYTLDKKLNLE